MKKRGMISGLFFAFALCIFGVLYHAKLAQGVDYVFTQDNWNGGQTSSTANHTNNQTGWGQYNTKDASIVAGTDLSLNAGPSAVVQTSYDDFNAGTKSNTMVSGYDEYGMVSIFATGGQVVKQLVTGWGASCAVTTSGRVYCWGDGVAGTIGNNLGSDAYTPSRVSKGAAVGADTDGTYLVNVRSVSVGQSHACAVTNANNIYCWGSNGYGSVGDGGAATARYVPVRVKKGVATGSDTDGTYLTNVDFVTAAGNVTCALTNAGTLYCWGWNSVGQVGDGTTVDRFTPVRVLAGAATGDDTDGTYLTNVEGVFGSSRNTCVTTKTTGNLYCWGYNSDGQLGDESLTNSSVPVRVKKGVATGDDTDGTYLKNVSSVTGGDGHLCALTPSNSGTVYCWGHASYGELGYGVTTSTRLPVRVVKGASVSADNDGTYLKNVSSIGAGTMQTCATTASGNFYCWGHNAYGGLGDGSGTNRYAPVQVKQSTALNPDGNGTYLVNSLSVDGGSMYSCGLTRLGNVYCWGFGQYGRLGNGGSSNYDVPQRVLGDFRVLFSTSAGTHTSTVIDTGVQQIFSILSYGLNKPTNTTSSVDIRMGDSITPDGTWTSWQLDVANGADISGLGAHRYVQYRVNMSTSSTYTSPLLHNISFGFTSSIVGDHVLISSPYNTEIVSAKISRIAWTENLAADTNIRLQLRTSPDGLTWGSWCGPNDGINGQCNSGTYFTNSDGTETVDDVQRDMVNDQYVQYKAILSSSNSLNTPVLQNVSLSYASISTPSVETISVSNLMTRSATLSANVLNAGGDNPTRYIEWGSIDGGPYNNSCTVGLGGLGAYSCNIANISPETTYYYRAKVTNGFATSYGDQMSFTTPALQDIIIPDPTTQKVTNAVSGGYMTLNSGTVSNTDKVQTEVNVTFRRTNIADAVFPINTEVSRVGGGAFDFANFVTSDVTSAVRQENGVSLVAVKVGVPNMRLTFSQPITMKINIGAAYNGQVLNVQYQEEGETIWYDQGTCTVAAGQCIFQTTHATTYTVNGDGTISGAGQNDITTDVQDVLSLDCDQTGNINDNIVEFGNLTPGTPVTGSTTCTVTTNSDAGYTLAVKRDDISSTMDKDSDTATDITDRTTWNSTTPNATTWQTNDMGLAFTVYNTTATKNTSWWGTGTTVTDANNNYAGFPVSYTDIMQHTSYSQIATTTNIGYKLDVPTTQKSGIYSGDITYQVVTAP